MKRTRAGRRRSSETPGVSRRRPGVRWLRLFIGAYLLALVITWVLLHLFADQWWPATLLLFGPRWFAAVPLLWFAPLALVLDRRSLIWLAAGAMLVFWPIMGWNFSLKRTPENATPDVRLLTYNIGTDNGSPTPPLEDLWRLVRIAKPDVITLQECTFAEQELVPMFPGYNINTNSGTCFLSRFPIVTIDPRNREDVIAVKGSGAIDRYEVATPKGVISVLNLHLATVRTGLQSVIDRSAVASNKMHYSVGERRAESRVAREWADRAKVPLLIAGDFNMPSDSQIFRRYWADFDDSFERCGTGYGFTKFTKWFGIRIDHILSDEHWDCLDISVDTSMSQGDHRPVIAEFRLR